jgi:hypothetical protein
LLPASVSASCTGATPSAILTSGRRIWEQLRLTFDAPPGIITDLAQLRQHHRMHTLQAAHLDNQFRDWVEESKAFGQAACKAYTRAWRAIEAIADG